MTNGQIKRLCHAFGCSELLCAVEAGSVPLSAARLLCLANHENQRRLLVAMDGMQPREQHRFIRATILAEREIFA